MMKALTITFAWIYFAYFGVCQLSAQINPGIRADNLQEKKKEFFIERLQLTPAEADKFWPVFADYQNRKEKITRDRNNLLIYFESNKLNMTDAEAKDIINKYIAYQEAETKLLETYTQKFSEILPSKKVIQVYVVELEFKKWLLENLRQNKVPISPRN